MDRCYKLHGFPSDNTKNYNQKKFAHMVQGDESDNGNDVISASFTKEQYSQLLNMLDKQKASEDSGVSPTETLPSSSAFFAGKMCLFSCSYAGWIVDSGATDHICYDLSKFISYKPISHTDNTITVPDGRKVPVTHIGYVKLTTNIILRDVLYVPDFHFNLISIPKLCTDMSCYVTFTSDLCIIHEPSLKREIVLGKFKTGLYYADEEPIHSGDTTVPHSHLATTVNKSCTDDSCAFASVTDDIKLWHLRLGHLPFSQIKHVIPGLPHSSMIDTICQICPSAKQSRMPFPLSSIKSTKCFQLIHIDVWGPYKVSTHTGCNMFLTIVDDFSRYTWVHLIKHKSDSVAVLENFIQYVKNQFDLVINCIRSDNAKELCEGKALALYLKHGIQHQSSCSDTPQQNGVVERKHRHILETSRALFFQSKLPNKYWGDSVLCATYLINRMPLQVLHNISPYEKLHHTSPSLDHLRIFGCLCFVSTSKVHRTKFDPRADACAFLGYSSQQKGYKVLHLSSQKITISRDVVFHEKYFPFHISSTPSLTSPFNFFLPATNQDHIFQDPFDSYPTSTSTPSISITSPATPSIPSPLSISSPISPSSETTSIPSSSTHNTFSTTIHDLGDVLPSSPHLAPRVSSRLHQPPSWLEDYVCNTALSSHWCNLVHYNSIPLSYQCSIAQSSSLKEPTSYKEASLDNNWIEAMTKELAALSSNNTWDIVPLPSGKKPIGCKWVFKIKQKADGSIERYKARLVAKGYNQKYGVDYQETFIPVVKMSTVRTLIAIAAHRGWSLFQLDVNNAFLHGDLHEEVYMAIPEGVPHSSNHVCKLKKSLYGLKQASRQWFAKLVAELTHQGFHQSKNDYSLFIKKDGPKISVAAVYVDDIILTGNDVPTLTLLKQHLHDTFSIKDLGLLSFFLGLEISYLPTGIALTEKKFTRELLEESGLTSFKSVVTPLPVNLKLQADLGDLLPDPSLYRSLVGKLNFLTNTRPDLAFTVQNLSQFMHSPRSSHMEALNHTLRYVAHTEGQGILLKATDQLTLQVFSDSDWASCPDSRRSITGYVLQLGSSPISWKSKKQATVSKSSSEAEYRAMASAAAEVSWMVRLLEELGVSHLQHVLLHCDNQSAIHIGKNPVFHECTKHIDIDCHFTREKVLEGLIQLTYLPTSSQLADVLTKVLPSAQFQDLLSKLGMFNPPAQLEGGC